MFHLIGRLTRSPNFEAGLTTALALGALLPVWWLGNVWYQTRLLAEQRARVTAAVALHANSLALAIERRFAPLDALTAFVQAEMDDGGFGPHFETFAAGLYAGSPEIRSLALAPDGIIRFVYPVAGNESLLNYAPAQDERAAMRADAQRALDTGEVVMTGPIELIQGGVGLIARRGIDRPDGAAWGLVNVAVNLPPIIAEAGLLAQPGDLQVAVRDEAGNAIWGAGEVWSQDPVVQSVKLPEGEWQLAGLPAGGWTAAVQGPLVEYQITTLVMAALLAAMVFGVTHRQLRLAAAVRERTLEITHINERLEADLAERRRVESELRVSEERYRTLARNFPNGAVILFDHDLRYSLADGAGLAEVGLSKERLEGKTIWELFAPEVTARLEPHYRAALAGTPSTFEVPFADRIYQLHTLPIRDAHGVIRGGIAMTQNVTERQRAEEALRASQARNQAMVNAIPDLLLRMNRAGVYLDYHAERASDLVFRPVGLIGQNIRDLPIEPALVARVLGNIEAALNTGTVQTIEYSLKLADGQHDYEARCVASGQDEVVVIVRDITERKRAEMALARWAHIFEHAEWGVAVGSANGQTLELVNPAYARMHGYTVEELIGQPIARVFASGAEADLTELIRVANETGHAVIEQVHRRKDGSEFPVLVDLTAVRDDAGRLLYRVANVQDITERKRVEAQLQASEERFRSLIEISPVGVILADPEGNFRYVSPSYERAAGYSAAELLGRSVFSVVHPEDVASVRAEFAHLMQHLEYIATAEYRHVRPDGSLRLMEANGRVLPNGDVVGYVQDVTERRRAEETLRTSQKILAEAERMANLGAYQWEESNGEWRLTSVSDQWLRIHGCRRRELAMSELMTLAHPDDLPAIERAIREAMAGRAVYDIEHRIVRQADGQVRVIQSYAEIQRDEAGRPIKMYGAAQDITERRQAEGALREREAQYRSIFEATTDGLFINDLNGRLVDFNPAAAHMHGYTVEEFRALQPAQFIHPESLPVFSAYLEAARAGRAYRARCGRS